MTTPAGDNLPDDIREELQRACKLHQRAVSDYTQCEQFSRVMAGLLSKLEDGGYHKTADQVMTILLHCNPKTGAHCDKATVVSGNAEKLMGKHLPSGS